MCDSLVNNFSVSDVIAFLSMIGAIFAAFGSWRSNRKAKKSEHQAEQYAKNADETNQAAQTYFNEQKQQFNEINRPVVDVMVDVICGSKDSKRLGFIFQNTGKKYAKNIKVEINNDFIDKLKDVPKCDHKKSIVRLTESTFNLGINQMFPVAFCGLGEQNALGKVTINVSYTNDIFNYSDKFSFDLTLDNWRWVDTTDLAQIRNHIENISENMKKLIPNTKHHQTQFENDEFTEEPWK